MVVGWKDETIEYVKRELMGLFEMRDLGRVSKFLGVQFLHQEDGVFVIQQSYTEEVLKRFGMRDCKPVSTPLIRDGTLVTREIQEYHPRKVQNFKEMIGSLLYLSTRTRPDIATAVGAKSL